MVVSPQRTTSSGLHVIALSFANTTRLQYLRGNSPLIHFSSISGARISSGITPIWDSNSSRRGLLDPSTSFNGYL